MKGAFMKFLILALMLIAPMAQAFDVEAAKALHQKYCDQKVEEACATIECVNNPKAECKMPEPTAKRKVQLEKQAAEIKKRCPKEEDHECMLKENKDITKQVLEMDCINGDKTACYFIDLSKTL